MGQGRTCSKQTRWMLIANNWSRARTRYPFVSTLYCPTTYFRGSPLFLLILSLNLWASRVYPSGSIQHIIIIYTWTEEPDDGESVSPFGFFEFKNRVSAPDLINGVDNVNWQQCAFIFKKFKCIFYVCNREKWSKRRSPILWRRYLLEKISFDSYQSVQKYNIVLFMIL